MSEPTSIHSTPESDAHTQALQAQIQKLELLSHRPLDSAVLARFLMDHGGLIFQRHDGLTPDRHEAMLRCPLQPIAVTNTLLVPCQNRLLCKSPSFYDVEGEADMFNGRP